MVVGSVNSDNSGVGIIFFFFVFFPLLFLNKFREVLKIGSNKFCSEQENFLEKLVSGKTGTRAR